MGKICMSGIVSKYYGRGEGLYGTADYSKK